ncbi:MAG: M23 family metallopeptidase [Pikeienuella sp.]
MGRRGGYGRTVEISHGSSTMTRYAHLNAIAEGVREGQQVAAGDRIGTVGSSGAATGPNLHYEVRVDGRPTDPLAEDQNIAISRTTQSGEMALEHLVRARADLQQLMTKQSPTQRTSSES